jgi:hypothetical protein
MGLTTSIGLWVVMQVAGASGAERPIAYYQDKNECTFIAASNPKWACQERKDYEEVKKQRDASIKGR